MAPEHFAIIPVDCAKPEARTRVADFYGNVLLEPFSFDITSALIRRSADLGTKTDDVDLAAIHRAAVDGLAMRPEVLDSASQQWRLLTRHRRDLVEKAATLKVQLKETIDAYLPGYTRLWNSDNFWESPIAATIATTFDSPQALGDAPLERFRQVARDAGSVIQKNTVDRIRAWTHQAAPPDDGHQIHFRRAISLWGDLRAKRQEIAVFELDLADFLGRSPCVLLLAFPGIHVVSASDYAAELGPITNYATSKSIAGRAGLYPARWQSGHTDHPDGPLVARRNRQLRAALMRLARNLDRSNHYFMGMAEAYARRHDDHDPKVVIARAFSRLSYYVIAAERLLPHAAIQHSERVLEKVLNFYLERHAAAPRVTEALNHAVARLSGPALRAERDALAAQQRELEHSRRRTAGMCRLSEILPQVLLRIQQRLQEEPADNQQNKTENFTTEDVTHGS